MEVMNHDPYDRAVKRGFSRRKMSGGTLSTGKPAGEKSRPLLVDLAAIMEQYPDIRGWISIPDTDIDYQWDGARNIVIAVRE